MQEISASIFRITPLSFFFVVNNQTALDVENRLRKFMSDIMAPFNERIGTLNKDVKKLKTDRDYCMNQLQSVNNKIDAFSHFKEQLGKFSNDLNNVVSSNIVFLKCYI